MFRLYFWRCKRIVLIDWLISRNTKTESVRLSVSSQSANIDEWTLSIAFQFSNQTNFIGQVLQRDVKLKWLNKLVYSRLNGKMQFTKKNRFYRLKTCSAETSACFSLTNFVKFINYRFVKVWKNNEARKNWKCVKYSFYYLSNCDFVQKSIYQNWNSQFPDEMDLNFEWTETLCSLF